MATGEPRRAVDLSTPDGIRRSVSEFRHPATSNIRRGSIRNTWVAAGIPNQFAAMFRAADMEAEAEMRA